MNTLEEMAEVSRELDTHKHDWTANSSEISFDEETAALVLKPTLFGAPPPMDVSDWALAQVCQKVGHIGATYAKDCPPWLRAVNLNHWMGSINKDLMVRSFDGTCRAVLSAQYAPIMNTTVLEKAAAVMKGTDYYEQHYLDQNTFHGKFTVGNRPGGDASVNPGGFGVGYYLGNGEIGNRAVRVCPYIQRTACTNSIIFQDWGIEIRHYHTTPAYIFGAIKETIGKAIGLAAEAVDRFVEAEMVAIPEVGTVIDDLALKYNLSLPVKNNVLFGMEGKATVAGVINGISYAAQQIVDVEARIDMENLAGAILVDPSVLKRKTPIQLNAMEDFIEGDNDHTIERDHTFFR